MGRLVMLTFSAGSALFVMPLLKSPPECKERAMPRTGTAGLQAENRYLSSLEKRKESGTC